MNVQLPCTTTFAAKILLELDASIIDYSLALKHVCLRIIHHVQTLPAPAHHRCEGLAALRQVLREEPIRRLHPWGQAALCGHQQNGLHRAALLTGQDRGDPEGDQ